jgi:hypothetical protein
MDGRSTRMRLTCASLIAVLAVFSLIVNVAVASTPADVGAWQGSKVQSYVRAQEDFSGVTGNPISSNVLGGTSLPLTAPADTLFVLDDCAGLFLSNGENYNPWVPVSLSSPFRQDFSVRFSRPARTFQNIALMTVGRDVQSTVYLEYSGSKMRVLFSDPLFFSPGLWTPVTFGKRYDIEVVADIPRQNVNVTIDGRTALESLVSSGELQVSGVPSRMNTLGEPFDVAVRPVRKSPLCTRLVDLKPSLSMRRASAPGTP